MVKEAKRPDVNRGALPRRKPGPVARPGDAKTDRLMMRIHPDLMEALTERARERGINRALYVEKILIGWINLDPRNRKLDLIGKVNTSAPSPFEARKRSSLEVADRWRKFCTASELLFGHEPPQSWFDEWEYNSGFGDYGPEGEDDDGGQIPPSFKKKK